MQLTSAPLIFLASLLPAIALATPTPRQSNTPVALTYSSTSPYGQSTGYLGLTQGSYGYGMTMVATDSETISAHLDGNGGIVQDCPNAGLVGALVAQADGITWNFEWVEESALGSLPAGSTTTSFTQGAPASWSSSTLSTVGTTLSHADGSGIWAAKPITGTTGVYSIGWKNETAYDNGDVQTEVVLDSSNSVTC